MSRLCESTAARDRLAATAGSNLQRGCAGARLTHFASFYRIGRTFLKLTWWVTCHVLLTNVGHYFMFMPYWMHYWALRITNEKNTLLIRVFMIGMFMHETCVHPVPPFAHCKNTHKSNYITALYRRNLNLSKLCPQNKTTVMLVAYTFLWYDRGLVKY